MASTGEQRTLTAAFIPLIDCAPLVVAARSGLAAAEGIELVLQRETSWATVRDKISVGHVDVAHMLAPLPIAQNLGLAPLPASMTVPMTLGFGGNTVTVSTSLAAALAEVPGFGVADPTAAVRALAAIVAERSRKGLPKLVFGIVHRFSCQHYEFAYWAAVADLLPDRDFSFVVVPPPLMADALAAGHVDGFCVGEPWGSVAVARGVGRILTTKSAIWHSSLDKVLGMRRDWADANPDIVLALIRAVYKAAVWCDAPENREALAEMLSDTAVLGQPVEMLRPALAPPSRSRPQAYRPDYMVFAAKAATFPWVSHALWLYAQMVRWKQIEYRDDLAMIARRTFRPDLYRAALASAGVVLPSANAKVEGALTMETPVASPSGRLFLGPDGFFDGRIFDPDRLDAYIAQS